MILGQLVISTQFLGVGKVINLKNNIYDIAFFHSPENPYANIIQLQSENLKNYKLYSEQVIYVRDQTTKLWRRARYIGLYGETKHLVVFRENEQQICELSEIFILNTQEEWINPSHFLKVHANDVPYFYPFREKFIAAYIRQRASCQSIGAILSSSIELEPHQLAVVKRVLQDPVKKYLLADEVGLGKTIETGLLIREHVLSLKKQARVLVIVPDHLVKQWQQELCLRFHLEDVMPSDMNDQPYVEVVGYTDFYITVSKKMPEKTMLVVDEMHHVAAWAWGHDMAQQMAYYRLVHACEHAGTVLLLSGTPLNGNEKNFLAMLHCLSPKHYQLDEKGIANFQKAIVQGEQLGGMRGALVADNENALIESMLDELIENFGEDQTLVQMIEALRPLVDFFDGRDQDDEERRAHIQALNHYLGESYRLHERMLRNRRDAKGLSVLFPGLAGAELFHWPIQKNDLSLEVLILEYLSIFYTENESQYLEWLYDLLVSPQQVVNRCIQHLECCENEDEKALLQQIEAQAMLEQRAKDQVLLSMVAQALMQSENLKIVIFVDDTPLSKHVYQLLNTQHPFMVEHNSHTEKISFNDVDSPIRILICDHTGEDGLNLQGTERLVIHYAMTTSISRLEQRLGRVNRYSAQVKGMKAIPSWILVPEYEGIFNSWVDVLNTSVGIFNRTIASLQYVLEEQFDDAWKNSLHEGVHAFENLKLKLGIFNNPDENSLIMRELKKVHAQEELLNMDEDVQSAVAFAQAINQSDEQAEEDVQDMMNWIIKCLNFKSKKEGEHQFRLGYQIGQGKSDARTLIDVANFLKTCFIGIDSQNPPWTHVMSHSRRFLTAEAGSVYPMRYGQPFVDAIFNLLKQDARGASCAILRIFKKVKLQEPQIFFKTSWVVTHPSENSVIADTIFSPRVKSMWLDAKANIIDEQNKFYKLLNVAYGDSRIKDIYEEASIRTEVWQPLKQQVNLEAWSSWIDQSIEKSKGILKEQFQDDLTYTLVGLQAQIYLSQ